MRKAIIASYLLLAVFVILSIVQKNAEFMIYAGVLIPVVLIVHYTDNLFTYKNIFLWGFAIWMLMHLLGGLAVWNGTRFYDLILFDIVGEPYSILKYDQVVHFYCYVVIAGLLSSVVKKVVTVRASKPTVFIITVLAATGIGAINEIIEFLPVVLFASPGPGGYINTAIDLIMNFLGSIAGTWSFKKV